MARAPKKNADYFPHGSGQRDDTQVKSLRRKYRHTGYSIYTMLRELIAGADYFYLRVDPSGLEDIAGDVDEAAELVSEIMRYCVDRDLFQLVEIGEVPFLTDHRMIRDLKELLRKRGIDCEDLIRGKYSTAVISATETPQSKSNRVESTQSKVKQTKEKIDDTRQLYEKEKTHENGAGTNNSSGTQSNTSGTAQSNGKDQETASQDISHRPVQPASDSVRLDQLAGLLKGEQEWLDVTMMQNTGINKNNIDIYLGRFVAQVAGDKPVDTRLVSFTDKKKHFRSWLRKHLSYPENQPTVEAQQSEHWYL